jgi:CheY-like chemotaxis protein
MIKFNGNSILVVESDKVYAIQLKQILEERGAILSVCHSLSDARKNLNNSDFDMIICAHQIADGSARELMEWCKDCLSTLPIFSAIGNCTQIEKKQLEKLGVQHFLSKNDSVKLFNDISRALFSFDEFRKNYLDSRIEKGIQYELSVGDKVLHVKALEIMDKGVFLSFDAPFKFGHAARLSLTCTPELQIDSITVTGMLQGEFAEGQFFRVNDEFFDSWKTLLNQLDKKQEEVTMFLKKASGK